MVFAELIAGLVASIGIDSLLFHAEGDRLSISRKGENGKLKELLTLPLTTINAAQPFRYFEVFLDRKTTSATVFPKKADIIFQNPQTKRVRLTSVTLIPDANFKTNGFAEIRVNGTKLAEIKQGVLTDVDAFTAPLPDGGMLMEIGQKGTVEVFLATAAGAVAAAVSASMGDY